jgi:DHA3 family macrolide efflux protein-like MFS transporter
MNKPSQNTRTFYTLILTQACSLIGTLISRLAVSIWVYAETGNATPLALVAFFAALPMALTYSFSGVLADRWDRRYVMILADAGQAVGTLLLLLSFASGGFQLWHLYAISFLQALFGVFQAPAVSASITMLIPDEKRDRANAIQQMASPLSGTIAPALAAGIYALLGVTGAIFIDLLTFVVAITVVFNVHIPRPVQTDAGEKLRGSVWKEALGGFRYLWGHRPLLYLALYVAVVHFIFNGMMVLSTPYILARADQNEWILGAVFSVANLGSFCGGIVMGIWGGTRPRIYTIIPSRIVIGGMMIWFGASQHPLLLALAFFALAFPIPVGNAPFVSLFQVKTPPDIQGRIFATIAQINTALLPVSYLLVGPLADTVFEPSVGGTGWDWIGSLVGTGVGAGMGLMMVISGLLVIGISVWAFVIPSLRRLESILPDYAPVAADDADSDAPELPAEPEPAPTPSTN